MNVIDTLFLYTDPLGTPIETPVVQIGSGKPHVVMVALQHGWELIGLDTGLQIMSRCQPKGTVTLISVASPQAYLDGTRLVGANLGPSSKQNTNTNRVHPGKEHGNIAERSAWAIDQYIRSLEPDYVIDLHAYSSQSLPHCIVDPCSGVFKERIADWMQRSKCIWYWEYEGETLSQHALDQALSAIWVNRGVPSVTVELGPLNTFSPEQSLRAQATLSNVLTACEAIEGAIVNQVPESWDQGTAAWRRREIVYAGTKGGYMRPTVAVGTPIAKSDIVAEIVLPDGVIVDTVRAERDGVLFVWHDEYRVMAGSLLGTQLVAY